MSVETRKQSEVVADFLRVRFPEARTVLDVTYGRGGFWARGLRPTWTSDLNSNADVRADFRVLPFRDAAADVVVFDPPFQPATKRTIAGRIERAFTYADGGIAGLERLVRIGLREAWRVSRLGVLIKCQDYIHSHKPVWMSSWLFAELGWPDDCVHLVQSRPKIRAANWNQQRSVWRNHTTFYSFRRGRAR